MLKRKRRGAIVVLAAILLVVMVAMIAFAVDIGMITVARTEYQVAADAAALAGASRLPESAGKAQTTAQQYVALNASRAGGSPGATIVPGSWNSNARQFTAGETPFDALQVRVQQQNVPLFFGRVFGTSTTIAGASATAVVHPRDIVLVLDFSGSMNEHKKVDALKEAVAIFFDILDNVGEMDRVGFVRYSTYGELVMPLTHDFDQINRSVQKTKATGWTNIGQGMELARKHLQTNARIKASKMMVIMTDGLANRPESRNPQNYVEDEARASHAAGIDLYTISFGQDADRSLMDEVAEIGGDVHFNCTGGVKEQEAELKKVFEKIANKRKTTLVQ